METTEGSKISVRLSDDSWITGTFLGVMEEAGNTYYLLDLGRPSPRKINAGFILEIEEHPVAPEISLEEYKRNKIRAVT